VLLQAVRSGIVRDWRDYSHTRVVVELELAIRQASDARAWMEAVAYKRYEKSRRIRSSKYS